MAEDLRTRILVNLVGKPAVVVPFLGSMIAFASATMVQHPGMPVFAGIVGLLAAAGVVGYRFLFKMEEVREGVVEEMRNEGAKAHLENVRSREQELDELRRKLCADRDPRDEKILDDLRSLDGQFTDDKPWIDRLDPRSRIDTQHASRLLFDTSIQGLRDALQLLESSRQITHQATREQLMRQREAFIADAETSVGTLGTMLTQLQQLMVESRSTDDQARARRSLEESVQATIRTEARLRNLGADRRSPSRETE